MLANYFVFVLFYPKSWIVALVTQPHFQMMELFMSPHLQTSLSNTDFRLILLSKQLNVCAWSDLQVCKHAMQNYVEDIFKCSIVKIFEVLEMNPQSVCVFNEGLSLFFNFCKNLISTPID